MPEFLEHRLIGINLLIMVAIENRSYENCDGQCNKYENDNWFPNRLTLYAIKIVEPRSLGTQ